MPKDEATQLKAAADIAQRKLDEMIGGGGPASDAEAFIFDAEMIRLFADQLVSLTDLLQQLTGRVEALERRSGGDAAPGAREVARDD